MFASTQIVVPRFLRWGLALFLIIALPITVVQAQDFEAVQKRLLKAVKKDELTLEQAAMMMEVLREFAHEQEMEEREWHEEHGDEEEYDEDDEDEEEEAEDDRLLQRFKRAAMKIEQAVEDGKMSERDAELKIMAMKKELWGSDDEDEGENEWTDKEEEKENNPRAVEFRRMEERLHRAVENGRITEEDAKRRMMEMKKELWGDGEKEKEVAKNSDLEKRQRRMKYRDAETKITEMIKAGKVSEEAGQARLAAFKKQLWPDLGGERGAKRKRAEGDEREDQLSVRNRRFRALEKDLSEKVVTGEITLRQAEERLQSVRERMEAAAQKMRDGDEDHDEDDEDEDDEDEN